MSLKYGKPDESNFAERDLIEARKEEHEANRNTKEPVQKRRDRKTKKKGIRTRS